MNESFRGSLTAQFIDGQVNLRDAVRRTITFEGGGKKYELGEKTAVLFVRPRDR